MQAGVLKTVQHAVILIFPEKFSDINIYPVLISEKPIFTGSVNNIFELKEGRVVEDDKTFYLNI
ncbi:MAG: hypothetical protein GX115_11240 [Ruminiclostridium sp.]|nr:hypothetical protein [Ruminiclostridium sp.]